MTCKNKKFSLVFQFQLSTLYENGFSLVVLGPQCPEGNGRDRKDEQKRDHNHFLKISLVGYGNQCPGHQWSDRGVLPLPLTNHVFESGGEVEQLTGLQIDLPFYEFAS